jgi:plastocyanin
MSPVRVLALAAWVVVVTACTGTTAAPIANDTSTPVPSVRLTAPAALTPTAAPTPGLTGKVTMGDNYYAPDVITIAVGGTVTWEIVAGDAKHDIVASDGSFRSNSPMNRGDTFSFTFTKAGEYSYFCSFHTFEQMSGKVVVK